jgi:CcmD family protein
MKTLKRWCAVVWLSVMWGVVAAAQQPPQQQDEFLTLDQLPPQEQMAAAPLLIGAYAFVMAVLFFYVWSVARRLTTVQQEITRLDSAIKQGNKG